VLYATLAHTRGYAKFTPPDFHGPPAATPVASLHPAADTPAALFLLRAAIHRKPHSKAAHPILPTEGQPTRAANRQPQPVPTPKTTASCPSPPIFLPTP